MLLPSIFARIAATFYSAYEPFGVLTAPMVCKFRPDLNEFYRGSGGGSEFISEASK